MPLDFSFAPYFDIPAGIEVLEEEEFFHTPIVFHFPRRFGVVP
jgi:hypothetical protein